MRILCLTSRLPFPPDRGDKLRVFNFVRELAEEHDLTLVSFIGAAHEREHARALERYFEAIHLIELPFWRSAVTVAMNVWRSLPLQTLFYRSKSMERLVNRLVESGEYDVAYIHLFRMAPYLLKHTQLYRVLDLTDAISQEIVRSLPYRPLPWRLIYSLERPRIARYECQVAQSFEESWLISTVDCAVLSRHCPAANLKIVPNGVDLAELHPLEMEPVEGRLLFLGHMGVFHNVDAARYLAQEILPRVRRRIPHTTLQLVGAEPGPVVQELATKDRAVAVTGFVPDLNEALNRAAVFVAPLRFAAGVQNKVLEAMAAGRPVVTTSVVNQGVGANEGEHLIVADDTSTLVERIVFLLQHPEARERIGKAGRRFVEAHFRWDGVQERMEQIALENGL